MGHTGPAGRQAVWVLDKDNQPKAVPVTFGLTDGVYTEVTGGLLEGDRVVIASFGKKQPAASAGSPFGGGAQGGGGRRGGF